MTGNENMRCSSHTKGDVATRPPECATPDRTRTSCSTGESNPSAPRPACIASPVSSIGLKVRCSEHESNRNRGQATTRDHCIVTATRRNIRNSGLDLTLIVVHVSNEKLHEPCDVSCHQTASLVVFVRA